MNIPELSMSLSQSKVMSDVSLAVLDKSLDSMETAGVMMTDMIEASLELSVNPMIGGNIDLSL